MAQSLLEENRKDAAAGITAEMLRENWERITRQIKKLPDAQQIEALYKELGVIATLPQIHIPENLERILLDNSPMVRNRLTFMRLRRCMEV